MDHTHATKEHHNWAPRPIWDAFCTIFQAGPVGTGLGVKCGRNLAPKPETEMYILVYKQSDSKPGATKRPLVPVGTRAVPDPGLAW